MGEQARLQVRTNSEAEEYGDVGAQGEYVPIAFGGYAQKVTVVGAVIYLAVAKPGTQENEAKWRVCKIDTTSGVRTTWAHGDVQADNIATDLTALEYS